jgi:hypothetical protein
VAATVGLLAAQVMLSPAASAYPFGAPANYATGTSPHSVVMADVTGDGKLDLVVGNSGSNDVSILPGVGNGSFGVQQRFAAGTRVKYAAVADMNGDAKPDVVTANEGANTVSVLIGNGSGGFGSPTSYSTCQRPHEVALADLNGDARPDVISACWLNGEVSVRLNSAGGVLGTATTYASGGNTLSIVAADFDGDGDRDVASANHGQSRVSVFLNNGSGSLATPVKYVTGGVPHEIRSRDLNGDGDLDLVTANDKANTVNVLLGNGNGTFGTYHAYATGLAPMSVAIADLDGDGAWDLATADSSGYPDPLGATDIGVLLGNGNGTFDTVQKFPAGQHPFSVAAGDLDADGDQDLASANLHVGNNATVLLNGGGPPPPPPSSYRDAVLASTPLGYWRLGETSGTTAADASGNARNGSYVGGPALGSPGLLTSDPNTAVTFDGVNDAVDIVHATVWNLTGDLTLEALINVTGGATNRVIVAKDASSGGPTFELRWVQSTGKLQFVQRTTGGATLSAVSLSPLAAGTTYHVAVTKTGATVRFYINGSLNKTVSTFAGTIVTNTRPVRIAMGDGGKAFGGRVDEVAIYGYALSSATIAAHAGAA